jgi:hypothetical protein
MSGSVLQVVTAASCLARNVVVLVALVCLMRPSSVGAFAAPELPGFPNLDRKNRYTSRCDHNGLAGAFFPKCPRNPKPAQVTGGAFGVHLKNLGRHP